MPLTVKISGNISYNILNGFTCVKLKGSEMDAQKAIAGSAGIKKRSFRQIKLWGRR